MARVTLAGSVLVAGLTTLVCTAVAAENAAPALQVDLRERKAPVSWKTRSGWVWGRRSPDAPADGPMLQVLVGVPGTHEVTDIRVESGAEVSIQRQLSDRSLLKGAHGEVLGITAGEPPVEARVQFEDRKGGDEHEARLRITADAKQAFFWIHSSCIGAGIEVASRSGSRPRFGYASVTCGESDEGETLLHVTHSPDAAWVGSSFGAPAAQGPSWVTLKAKIPQGAKGEVPLGSFQLRPAAGGPAHRSFVTYSSAARAGRERKEYQAALEELDKMPAAERPPGERRVDEGDALTRAGKAAAAADSYRRGREEDPENLEAWILEVRTLSDLGRKKEARAVRDRLVKEHPQTESLPLLKDPGEKDR